MVRRVVYSLVLLSGALPAFAQDEADPPAPSDHEARAQAVVAELAEQGYAVDLEQLTFEERDIDDCVKDIDRQQDLFFVETYYDGLAGLVWATSPNMERPPAGSAIRRNAVQQGAAQLGAYYQDDRQALVFPKTWTAAINDAMGARDLVVAHELVHAHQAQREGGSLAKQLHLRGRDVEQVRVAQCLMEGEAELVAVAILRARKGETLDTLTEAELDLATDLNKAFVGALDRIYDLGRRAVLRAYKAGGWEAVHTLVRQDHPASTEQLLHAEKRGQDVPVAVTLPDAPEGYALVHDDVYGELQLTQILGAGFPETGVQAAIGWDGDRMRLFRSESGEALFVWRTVWDRDEDAEQFAALFEDLPFVTRQGRVVDVLRASDEAVGEAYRQQLPAWEQAGDPEDAKTTAAIEAALAAKEAAQADRREGQRWEIPTAGMAFELPEGFTTQVQNGIRMAVLLKDFGDQLQFVDNVGVLVLPNTVGDDLDEHLELNRQQFAQLPSLELKSLEKGEVAGREVLVGRYEGAVQPGQPRLKFRLILALRGSEQVVVTGVVAEARAEQVQPLVDQLMDSLTWLDGD